MQLVEKPISPKELKKIAAQGYGNLVKAVVDLNRKVMVAGGELHADEEAMLLEQGSKQEHLWGINIYPEKPKSEWLEFDSMVNLRPSQGNRSRGVDDPALRKRITEIVDQLVV